MDKSPFLRPVSDGGERCCGRYRWLVVGLTFLVVTVLFIQRINLSVAIIPWAAECHWDESEQQV